MSFLLTSPSNPTLRRIVFAAFAVTLIIFVVFQIHDRPLQPYTIVSLELAGTPAAATTMFNAWGAAGNQAAIESLWIDFLFMPAYALLFAGLVLIEARMGNEVARNVGVWLCLAPFAAALADVVENVSLLAVMQNPAVPDANALALAYNAATVKFGLLLVVFLFLGWAWLARRKKK